MFTISRIQSESTAEAVRGLAVVKACVEHVRGCCKCIVSSVSGSEFLRLRKKNDNGIKYHWVDGEILLVNEFQVQSDKLYCTCEFMVEIFVF